MTAATASAAEAQAGPNRSNHTSTMVTTAASALTITSATPSPLVSPCQSDTQGDVHGERERLHLARLEQVALINGGRRDGPRERQEHHDPSVQVSAWAVLLHRDDLDDRAPGVQLNCFGDRFPGRLCPASPAVRDYVLAMTRELCRYPITALRAEALHYQGGAHGHHHERCLEDYGEIARFLLGLCFCRSCADQGFRHDVDVDVLAARCRAYLSGVFGSAPDARSLTEACGPDIHPYLAARTATVTTLARAAADQARQAGVRLTLLDETIPIQACATGRATRNRLRAEVCAPLPMGVGKFSRTAGEHEPRRPRAAARRVPTSAGSAFPTEESLLPAPPFRQPATRGALPSRFICQALRLTSQSCLVKLAEKLMRRQTCPVPPRGTCRKSSWPPRARARKP